MSAEIFSCFYKLLQRNFFSFEGYDIESLIIGGDIIASRNKEKRSMVLYPRGKRFLSRLSGTVTAVPGKQCMVTSANLRDEIRRGEAIQVRAAFILVQCIWLGLDNTIFASCSFHT